MIVSTITITIIPIASLFDIRNEQSYEVIFKIEAITFWIHMLDILKQMNTQYYYNGYLLKERREIIKLYISF